MADEADDESKTEDPSPKRREDARRQGQVPFSAEFVGAVVLLAGVAGLMSLGGGMWAGLIGLFRHDLPRAFRPELGADGARTLFVDATVRLFVAFAPFFGLLLLAGMAGAIVQVGFDINTEKLEFKFDRLNPAGGLGKLFSVAALVKGLLALLKVAALSAVAYWVLGPRLGVIMSVGRDRLPGAAAAAWAVITRLALYLSGAVAVVAAVDFAYQRRRFEKSLMMTKQELKEEAKQEDGDPHIKARIRQIQRERARQRMLRKVPQATVVVTNPTHYAVALRYDPAAGDDAPVVVAKGAGLFAKRIRDIARENRVPVLERPALARAVYGGVKEGQAIPPALFKAVAEVIGFVFQLRGVGPPAG